MMRNLVTSSAVAFDGPMRDGYWRDRPHPWLVLATLGVIVAAAILVTWLVASRRPAHHPAPPGAPVSPPAAPVSPTANAEAILAERLARGEISPDDYRTMLAVLRGTPPPSASPS